MYPGAWSPSSVQSHLPLLPGLHRRGSQQPILSHWSHGAANLAGGGPRTAITLHPRQRPGTGARRAKVRLVPRSVLGGARWQLSLPCAGSSTGSLSRQLMRASLSPSIQVPRVSRAEAAIPWLGMTKLVTSRLISSTFSFCMGPRKLCDQPCLEVMMLELILEG